MGYQESILHIRKKFQNKFIKQLCLYFETGRN